MANIHLLMRLTGGGRIEQNEEKLAPGATTLQGESSQKFGTVAGIKVDDSRAVATEVRLGCVVEGGGVIDDRFKARIDLVTATSSLRKASKAAPQLEEE